VANVRQAEEFNRTRKNPHYLKTLEYSLPQNVTVSAEPKILSEADFIIHTVPVQASLKYFETFRSFIRPETIIVSASKGLHSETLEMMSDIIPRAMQRNQPTAFISGPTFAKELIEARPSACVVASRFDAKAVAALFRHSMLRVYVTEDVIGVEVGGALKNVFAIAAGIGDGMGLGQNSMAMLVTRGCSEMTRLAVRIGARPETLSGLSGIGDLMLTCYSALSRNRTVGYRLGKGESLADIAASMNEICEGVATTPAALALSRKFRFFFR
jgi:glycerol-3-phosphate dehydrogenase (NAD+)